MNQINPITIAQKITTSQHNPKPVYFNIDPEKWLDYYDSKKYSHILMIQSPADRRLQMYPVTSNEVIKVILTNSELTPDYLADVSSLTTEKMISSVYSIAMAVASQENLYEIYIDKNEISPEITIEMLESWFGQVRGVTNVEIELVEVSAL